MLLVLRGRGPSLRRLSCRVGLWDSARDMGVYGEEQPVLISI